MKTYWENDKNRHSIGLIMGENFQETSKGRKIKEKNIISKEVRLEGCTSRSPVQQALIYKTKRFQRLPLSRKPLFFCLRLLPVEVLAAQLLRSAAKTVPPARSLNAPTVQQALI